MRTRAPSGSRLLGAPGQRGDVSAELAIGASVLILIIFGLAQLALWLHAVNIAVAAAQEGARAARTLTGSTQAGRETTERYLAHLGPQLHNPQVQVTRTATATRVEINAQTEAVLFGLDLPVRAIAESPTERLTQPVRPPAGVAGWRVLAHTPSPHGEQQR